MTADERVNRVNEIVKTAALKTVGLQMTAG